MIKAHVLRAGLSENLYANKNVTDKTERGFLRFWYLKVEATWRTLWLESADPEGEDLPNFLPKELQDKTVTWRCTKALLYIDARS